MPLKQQWPALGRVSENHHEHGILIVNECKQLKQLEQGRTAALHDLLPLFNSILKYVEAAQLQPEANQILAEIQSANRKLNELDSKITVIKQTTETPPAPAPSAPGPKSWAQMAATATAIPTRPTYKDREVTIQLRNPETVKALRGLDEAEMKKRINFYIHASPETSTLTEPITAVRQLKSGDLTVYTRNSIDAKLLQKFPGWVTQLGSGAGLYQRKYSVMVHGIQVSKLALTDTNNKTVTEGIQMENHRIINGIQIQRIFWLNPKAATTKDHTSAVLDFTQPEHANRAIEQGIIIGAKRHDCELFDRACQLKQCFVCHTYGHIGSRCGASQLCGFCAGPHKTHDCSTKGAAPGIPPKCAVCSGAHTAWSRLCEARVKEYKRIEFLKQTHPRLHPEFQPPLQIITPSGTTSPTLTATSTGPLDEPHSGCSLEPDLLMEDSTEPDRSQATPGAPRKSGRKRKASEHAAEFLSATKITKPTRGAVVQRLPLGERDGNVQSSLLRITNGEPSC